MTVRPRNAALRQSRFDARVNDERARRIDAGATVSVEGVAIALQGRAEDQTNLGNLAALARDMLAANPATAETIAFRDRENAIHMLTPAQILELWRLGVLWVSACYAASWQIKTMPLDTDPTDDSLWPE